MGEQTRADVVSMRVTEGDRVNIEGLSLDVLYTPGHTDDFYSYLLKDRVVTGDTLLIRSTGPDQFPEATACSVANGRPEPGSEVYVGRRLGDSSWGAFASRRYLDRHGAPAKGNMRSHRRIEMEDDIAELRAARRSRTPGNRPGRLARVGLDGNATGRRAADR